MATADMQTSARPPITPPIIAPVLFGGLPESSPSDAGSGSEVGVEDPSSSEGLEDSASEDLVAAGSVGRVLGSSVGVWKIVCVSAVAPQAMYENPASSLRAKMTVEQNWSLLLYHAAHS